MPNKRNDNVTELERRPCVLGDLFDETGNLRALRELPPEIAAEVSSFDVLKVKIRRAAGTVVTEELIRVRLRDRRTASIGRRGARAGDSIGHRAIHLNPLQRRLVTTQERSAGGGCTSAAEVLRRRAGLGNS